jgi:methionine sulfoxide reductase heme-binding subunit
MPTAGTASAAAGVISLILLTLSVVLGILVSKRRELPLAVRYPSRRLHENVSLLALGFLVVHVLLAIAVPFGRAGGLAQWLVVVIPFVAGPGRLWLGLGAISFDLLVAVIVTSLLRRRIGRKAWRVVHWTSYACWPAAEAHSVGFGFGFRSGRLFDLAIACVLAVVLAGAWRLAGAGVWHGSSSGRSPGLRRDPRGDSR